MSKKIYSDEELFEALEADWLWFDKDIIQQARNNDQAALNQIIQTYYKEKDYPKALAWCRKAVAQNNSNAQFMVGHMCEYGLGMPRDVKLAMRWYLKAAENDGHKEAQFRIGEYYYNGWEVPRNVSTAIEWFTKAANQGHSDAQFSLGCVYEDEKGIKDIQKSLHWYTKAADNGHTYAVVIIENLNSRESYSKEEFSDEEQPTKHTVKYNDSGAKMKNQISSNTREQGQSSSTNVDVVRQLQIEKRMTRIEDNIQLLNVLITQDIERSQQMKDARNKIEEQQKKMMKRFEKFVINYEASFQENDDKMEKIVAQLKEKDEEMKTIKSALSQTRVDTKDKPDKSDYV